MFALEDLSVAAWMQPRTSLATVCMIFLVLMICMSGERRWRLAFRRALSIFFWNMGWRATYSGMGR
eukprot:1680992-Alexandrium_andersonii.AAC.1